MGPTLGFQPPILGIVAECQASLKRLAAGLARLELHRRSDHDGLARL